jgi:hypothetical protein
LFAAILGNWHEFTGHGPNVDVPDTEPQPPGIVRPVPRQQPENVPKYRIKGGSGGSDNEGGLPPGECITSYSGSTSAQLASCDFGGGGLQGGEGEEGNGSFWDWIDPFASYSASPCQPSVEGLPGSLLKGLTYGEPSQVVLTA